MVKITINSVIIIAQQDKIINIPDFMLNCSKFLKIKLKHKNNTYHGISIRFIIYRTKPDVMKVGINLFIILRLNLKSK